MPNMPANFGTQPARPPFAWLLLPALRAGVSKAGAPMPSGAATPTPPYGTRFLVGPINRAACIPRLSCFSARQPHQSDIWLPLCCLPCCLCARLISFDFLAPSISQSAQCRQVIAHEQHGLHLEPLLRCSSTHTGAGRGRAQPCCARGWGTQEIAAFDFLAPSISQSAQCRQLIAHEQHGLHLEPLLRCSPCCAAGRNLAAHADGGCGKRKVHWETAYYEGLAANQLYIIKTVTQSGRP